MCWFGKEHCFRTYCNLVHDNNVSAPECRFGTNCTRKDCVFTHKDDCIFRFGGCSINNCLLRHVEKPVEKVHMTMDSEDTRSHQYEPIYERKSSSMLRNGIATTPCYSNSSFVPAYRNELEYGTHCRGNYASDVPIYQYPVKRLTEQEMSKNFLSRYDVSGKL